MLRKEKKKKPWKGTMGEQISKRDENEFQDEIAITHQCASWVLCHKLSGTAKLFGSSS